jgi:5-methylcytosine-specific restriction protein A
MKTIEEKLNSLDSDSVWIFTKQETDFDESYKSALLFSEIANRKNVNIESYFANNHDRYNIQTDRHRILIIPQFFGLITKTPFYARSPYNDENPTAVFDLLKKFPQNSAEYNTIKTEQLLKLKIHAIIDTANNNQGYNVLPVIFIFKVLKTLKDKYGITRVSLGHLYTYVMTCSCYDEIDEAVEFIRLNAPISPYVADYKNRSRVLTCIKKNIKLFDITESYISLNKSFEDYFYNNFICAFDMHELHEMLLRDVDYSYFLQNIQGFNINLIDIPDNTTTAQIKKIIPVSQNDELYDSYYNQSINEINDDNINEKVAEGAHKTQPVKATGTVGRRNKTNPLLGKIALKKANYSCQNDKSHQSFISSKTGHIYMEAHHLIPVCCQNEIWEKYGVNIDCTENLISLCPTCHRAIHYGTSETQIKIITRLYAQCKIKFKKIGLDIEIEDILKLYKID